MPLNNVPQAGQTLAQTRDPIRNNFNSINTAFNINHVDFGLGDQGKHKWVSMPTQVADPVTTATETAIYTKTVGGILDLFFRRANNGSVFNATGSNYVTAGSTSATSAGYTRLPSGILIKWGTGNVAAGVQNFTFPGLDNGGAAIPAFGANGIFGGTVSPRGIFVNLTINGWGGALPANQIQLVASAAAGFSYVFFGKE